MKEILLKMFKTGQIEELKSGNGSQDHLKDKKKKAYSQLGLTETPLYSGLKTSGVGTNESCLIFIDCFFGVTMSIPNNSNFVFALSYDLHASTRSIAFPPSYI